MMEPRNLNRRFGVRIGVLCADKGVNSANKAVLALVFTLNVTIYCAQDECEKRCRECR